VTRTELQTCLALAYEKPVSNNNECANANAVFEAEMPHP
jgi:hypothetical protein